jgi:hypothetical protein
MRVIQKEIDRIGEAIRRANPVPRYDELYAVQQALLWVLDPETYKSPYDLLVTGTPEGSEDCLEENGRSASSSSLDHRVSEPSPIPTSPAH